MPRQSLKPTAALELQITAFIRAGGFPHVAAEAAGVPRRTFERWLRYGKSSRREPLYHSFRAAVQRAVAQARLRAEIAVLDAKPLDWLKFGPGKETADNPGWTAVVKPSVADKNRSVNVMELPEFRALLAALPQALADFPEAREVLLRLLNTEN